MHDGVARHPQTSTSGNAELGNAMSETCGLADEEGRGVEDSPFEDQWLARTSCHGVELACPIDHLFVGLAGAPETFIQ